MSIVDLITQHGMTFVFANVFVQQMGLPIPAAPTLIVAGALAAEGRFSAMTIFAAAAMANVLSDALWYAVGRRYGQHFMYLPGRLSRSPQCGVSNAEVRFRRWGPPHFDPGEIVPGGSLVASLLAGSTNLGWLAFALFDGVGAALWSGAP